MLCIAYNNLAVQRECLHQPCVDLYLKAVSVAEQYMDAGNPLLDRFRASLVAAQSAQNPTTVSGSCNSDENDKSALQSGSSGGADDGVQQRPRRPLPPPLPVQDTSASERLTNALSSREGNTNRSSASPRVTNSDLSPISGSENVEVKRETGMPQRSQDSGGQASSKAGTHRRQGAKVNPGDTVPKSGSNASIRYPPQEASSTKCEPRRPSGPPSKRRPRSGSESNRLPGQKGAPQRASSADFRSRSGCANAIPD